MRQMTMFAQRLCSMLVWAFFAGAFALALSANASGASAFTFTTIDVPGAAWTYAIGINAHGQIVGAFTDFPNSGYHGFLLDGGTFTVIDPPGATGGTEAGGINRGESALV